MQQVRGTSGRLAPSLITIPLCMVELETLTINYSRNICNINCSLLNPSLPNSLASVFSTCRSLMFITYTPCTQNVTHNLVNNNSYSYVVAHNTAIELTT